MKIWAVARNETNSAWRSFDFWWGHTQPVILVREWSQEKEDSRGSVTYPRVRVAEKYNRCFTPREFQLW